ncbi:hypothetical protein P4H32_26375 [Bacillus cereus]|nr:hypothetical protein [Bacillus cereus]
MVKIVFKCKQGGGETRQTFGSIEEAQAQTKGSSLEIVGYHFVD